MNPAFSISRRNFSAGSVLAGAALVCPRLSAQVKPEKTKVVIAVNGKAAFCYLPLTLAEQLGYFKAEGLNVEIRDFSSEASALHEAVNGPVDVYSSDFERTINLQSQNQFFQAFVLQTRAPQVAFGVSTKNLPNYQTVSDLKGKKIGVSSLGSSTNMLASLVLSRGGLKSSDVSFISVLTSTDAVSALRSGQIDAVSHSDPALTMLEQRGDVKIIKDTRTLKGTIEVFGGPMPGACLYASVEFVNKAPGTCQALTHAIVRSLKWLQTAGPGDILKTVPESYLLGDRALYLSSFNKVRESISLDGMISDDGPRTAFKALTSFDSNIKLERINLPKTYTNEFVRRAKERFKV